MRRVCAGILVGGLLLASCGDGGGGPDPDVLLRLGDAAPGDVISLRTVDGTVIEWIDRNAGEIRQTDAAAVDVPEVVASVSTSTLGEQWGLLGTVTIDGRRFASWTVEGGGDLRNGRLVVGELIDGANPRLVWESGRIGTAAVGGHLEVLDDQLLLGVGQNVDWGGEEVERGALLLLDPDGDPDQEPEVVSRGYVNPFAFTVTERGEIWVADNAAGEDVDRPGEDDVERIGRADLTDRSEMTASTAPDRAPSAMVELPDGRIGVCGFLDNELRAYEGVWEGDDAAIFTVERAGTIGPCNAGVAVLADGSIVTIAQTDDGEALLLFPAPGS